MTERIEASLLPDEAKARASEYVSQELIAHEGEPVLLLLSGGSALELLETIDPMLINAKFVTLGILDERISANPGERNIEDERLRDFLAKCPGVHTLPVEQHVTPETSGMAYDKTLHTWKDDHPGGFTMIIQGVGPDAHTAGIMPFPEDPKKFAALFEGEAWAVGYDAGNKNPHRFRMTVTNTFLRNEVDSAVVYAVGSNKLDPLKRARNPSTAIASAPAAIIRDMPKVVLFTDQAVTV